MPQGQPIDRARRQLRKGTFSCLECKRRKKRCRFDHSSATICVSCQRFGTTCRGQEFEETGSEGINERIRRVEGLVEQLEGLVEQRGCNALTLPKRRGGSRPRLTPSTSPAPTSVPPHPGEGLLSRCISLSSYLHAVLPVPAVAAQIIIQGKSPFTWMWRSVGFNPSSVAEQATQSAWLSPNTNPVVLARKLVQLALCLIQPSFSSSEDAPLSMSSKTIEETALGYIRTAQQVTNQDYLVRSVDGLEALLLEALYQMHIGNMAVGGHIFRRALDVAQIMGFNRLPADADLRVRYLWFRLAFANQWHALALGQPSAIRNGGIDAFASSLSDKPTQRLDEEHIGLAGRIISRNVRMTKSNNHWQAQESISADHIETGQIDERLKQAARSVSLTWWALPDAHGTTDLEGIEASARLMTQIHQNYLVVLAHQPYVIQALHNSSNAGRLMDNCKTNALYSIQASLEASRAILTRLTRFLEFPHIPASLKGLEHKICLAASTVLLVYLHIHVVGNPDALEHQRLSDVNLVLETVSQLEKVQAGYEADAEGNDLKTLRDLIGLDQAAADGAIPTFWSEWCGGGHRMGQDGDESGEVSLPYPYFGRITIFVRWIAPGLS
ncbi:uncharacterized protein LTR77_008768 [Saxophila tyrrhenica]|uniref:Zn(2)-C6 fungal-type domain-containing protein n=1 Tax=Saxophila tyrrhenica TaxID=1690608 RepID=A0AAV9P084_9PEZI|nr:hypothetical protein LTR77_008768 [Saxophila tyrrhenica]